MSDSDDLSKKLMNEVLSIEDAEVKTKRACADKVGKVLSGTRPPATYKSKPRFGRC